MPAITEADVEQVALDCLTSLVWVVAHGPHIALATAQRRVWTGSPQNEVAGCPCRAKSRSPTGELNDILRKHPCCHWNKRIE